MAKPRAGTGEFRRAGHFQISASGDVDPDVKMMAAFIHGKLLTTDQTIDSMPAFMASLAEQGIALIKHQTGLNGAAAPVAAAVATAAPPQSAEPPERKAGGKKNRRSEGARSAWVTRRLVNKYLDEHPGVSRADAFQAVIATLPGRTRVTDENAPMSRGRKAWNTRVEREITEAQERGQPISRDEARQIVARKMRGDRSTATPAAAEAAPPATGTEGADEQQQAA